MKEEKQMSDGSEYGNCSSIVEQSSSSSPLASNKENRDVMSDEFEDQPPSKQRPLFSISSIFTIANHVIQTLSTTEEPLAVPGSLDEEDDYYPGGKYIQHHHAGSRSVDACLGDAGRRRVVGAAQVASKPMNPVVDVPARVREGNRKVGEVQSILRGGRTGLGLLHRESSSVPSLVSLQDDDSLSSAATDQVPSPLHAYALGSSRMRRAVSFNSSVSIREFARTKDEHDLTWYSRQDFETFKSTVQQKIQESDKRNATNAFPNQGRLSCSSRNRRKAFFTHECLQHGDEDEEGDEMSKGNAIREHIRRILVVDPHDICLLLLSKALTAAIPHVSIKTATTHSEALSLAQREKFDVLIIEQSLKCFSRQSLSQSLGNKPGGCDLIRELSQLEIFEGGIPSLFVGVSSHLERDQVRLESCGADLTWSKPAPIIDQSLVDKMLKTLLVKRGYVSLAAKLFHP